MKKFEPPVLRKNDADNKELAGKFVLYFILNDEHCKSLAFTWMQALANCGLLELYIKVYYEQYPTTPSLPVCFMNIIAVELSTIKNYSKEQFGDFINRAYSHDRYYLEEVRKISIKYSLNLENMDGEKIKMWSKKVDMEEYNNLIFYIFASTIINSQTRIYSYCFNKWFSEKHQFKIINI